MSPDSDDEIDALPLGVTVNGYRLDAVLGRGGVGITYRGEALTGGDPVVIKEFLPTLAAVRVDGMVRARTQALKADYDRLLQAFLAEARTLEPYRALIHAGLDGDPPRPRVHGGAGPQSRPIPPSTAGNGSDSRLGGLKR